MQCFCEGHVFSRFMKPQIRLDSFIQHGPVGFRDLGFRGLGVKGFGGLGV